MVAILAFKYALYARLNLSDCCSLFIRCASFTKNFCLHQLIYTRFVKFDNFKYNALKFILPVYPQAHFIYEFLLIFCHGIGTSTLIAAEIHTYDLIYYNYSQYSRSVAFWYPVRVWKNGCVCDQKHPILVTHLYERIHTAHSSTFMSPALFARSIESYRECYSLLCYCLPGIF